MQNPTIGRLGGLVREEDSITDNATAAGDPLGDIARAFRGGLLLILGSIAWWASHYLLLWNTHIAVNDSFVSGYDGRFVLTIAGTVVTLGALAFFARRKPEFTFASRKISYVAFAVCASTSLGMLALPSFVEIDPLVSIVGAVLSGVGSSFMLVLCGELHIRMGLRFMPLAFALETVAGVGVFLVLSQFSFATEMLSAVVLMIVAAILLAAYAKTQIKPVSAPSAVRVDMTVKSLVVLAVLTGFAYGLVRTFAIGGLDEPNMALSMESEYLGTCLCALLLVVVYVLQNRQSLFELCLLFVVPLVATGMLLVSLQGVNAVIPTAINTGGFACFFNLMWYFAAVFAARGDARRATFLIALFFFSSQFGQLLGSLVPAQYANSFSSGLIYLLLLVTTLLMYWRAKAAQRNADAATAAGEAGFRAVEASGFGHEPVSIVVDRWTEQFGFSPREVEIVLLLMERTPYKQIGETLFVSGNTVKTHVRNIYKKADVSSREELLEKLNSFAKKG